ncbi:MAG: NADPH:quinone oxidoreductase [Alphaproteobacteria bacterium]|jgi:NADPH2:quinone reductase|nr:NADPH:quinone oxidoreductase [Alphaproteobacteria bacterium]PPR14457.1 MAG: Phthiocerol synthesis polyketide synthase type I PpsC [Alphaproteobacteria bacterium MarineAlpha12_Bin1]|tara:strand:+ start:10360 stop:11343 length:984 start_codon:yes stop_codon:yes gene_type:complete
MRAAFYDTLGLAKEVLTVGEQPTPEPGSGEVRVKLRSSGVNPSDTKARLRGRGGSIPFPLIIPQSDGAGVIDAIGEGVNDQRLGKRVWLMNGQWQRPFGTATEYICIESKYVIELPDGVDMAVGACFGIPYLTAHRAVMFDGSVSGETILVQGGAGAVGSYAIQIAKFYGARVITTVSSDEKAEYVLNVGADEVINYRTEDVPERITAMTKGRGVNRIVELNISANGPMYDKILSQGGTVIVYGTHEMTASFMAQNFYTKWASLKGFLVYTIDDAQRLESVTSLNKMLADGVLKTTIAKRFTLNDIVLAHEMVESARHIGNVVIDVS